MAPTCPYSWVLRSRRKTRGHAVSESPGAFHWDSKKFGVDGAHVRERFHMAGHATRPSSRRCRPSSEIVPGRCGASPPRALREQSSASRAVTRAQAVPPLHSRSAAGVPSGQFHRSPCRSRPQGWSCSERRFEVGVLGLPEDTIALSLYCGGLERQASWRVAISRGGLPRSRKILLRTLPFA